MKSNPGRGEANASAGNATTANNAAANGNAAKGRTFSIDEPSKPGIGMPSIILQRQTSDSLKEDLLSTIGKQPREPTREEIVAAYPTEDSKSIPQYGMASSAVTFQRVSFGSAPPVNKEIPEICQLIQRARKLREKWVHGVFKASQQNWGGISPDAVDGAYAPIGVKGNIFASPTPRSPGSKRRRPEIPYTVGQPENISIKRSGHGCRMHKGVVMVFAPSKQGGSAGKRLRTSSSASSSKAAGAVTSADCVFGGEFTDSLSIGAFYKDLVELQGIVNNGPVKSWSFRQLQQLAARFKLHCQLNAHLELAEQKSVPHRDFYNVRKVDTHVHHSACMHQKHLLRFIKSKLKKAPDDQVLQIRRDGPGVKKGQVMTLIEVFQHLKLTAYDLNLDTLDMHCDTSTFHRFDRFNLKYNPCGQPELREIFLKTDNMIKGRYLAELTREVEKDMAEQKYSLVEWRISIYGRRRDEWTKLARWWHDHRLSCPQVRWLIQVPRIYNIYKKLGLVHSFQTLLDNIFLPLFEVTEDPQSDPVLHTFLRAVVGLDCVDDESKPDVPLSVNNLPTPEEWTSEDNPPYWYWLYYLSANLTTLNAFRAARESEVTSAEAAEAAAVASGGGAKSGHIGNGSAQAHAQANGKRSLDDDSGSMPPPRLNQITTKACTGGGFGSFGTFEFRPHCGEAGPASHLISAYLTSHKINHGILLRKSPSLHYLFYLDQIGVALSPISNNKLFLDYDRNPFLMYHQQGLNVSLSTDDPLMLHFTKDALLEEYSVAAQIWKLSSTDMCEIARNSVLQSGFEHPYKAHFLGKRYYQPGPEGNDITMTNVPNIRVSYRHEVLQEHLQFLIEHGKKAGDGGGCGSA